VVVVVVDVLVLELVMGHNPHLYGQVYSKPVVQPKELHSLASEAIEQSIISQRVPENPFAASHLHKHVPGSKS